MKNILATDVGWVERSDTQHLQTMGIALLNPSYLDN
jgi:hypothetical protein